MTKKELFELKGQLKKQKRYDAMAKRWAERQRQYDVKYQLDLAKEISDKV